MPPVLMHTLRRAARSLWENLYLNAVAAGVIGAALLLMGVYLTVQHNLNTIVNQWDRDVHVSAYFHPDVSEDRRFALREEMARDPRVERVRYISEADAAQWLVERVDGLDDIMAELGEDALPASLEISLFPEAAEPENIVAYAESIQGVAFQDIDYGREWIERFNTFLSLLKLLGAVLGFLILVAALFLVMNTIHLVVYNRRDELEVQKLVGATNGFITAPFLIEGAVHGLVGSGLAMTGLYLVHRLLVVRLQHALQLGQGGDLQFMPSSWLLLLCLSGTVLGVGAALVAVQRFLAKAP